MDLLVDLNCTLASSNNRSWMIWSGDRPNVSLTTSVRYLVEIFNKSAYSPTDRKLMKFFSTSNLNLLAKCSRLVDDF